MTNKGEDYTKICRFCGHQKTCGKFIFSTESVKIGLLTKIKCLFPDEIELINSETTLPKYICDTCESTINYFYEFRNGVKLLQQNLQKKADERIASNRSKLLQHTNQHFCTGTEEMGLLLIRFNPNRSITCQNCNMKLRKDQIYNETERPSVCICCVCGCRDDTRLFLSRNSRINCPKCMYKKKKPLKENIENSARKFECNVCNKVFRSTGHLNRHCLTHYGSKPFSCEDCGAGFNQKSSLKTHMLIHEKTNPFSCKWCGQQFRHKQTLANHVMSIHGMASDVESLYECDKCKKRFVHKGKLNQHYRSHSGEKPFKCNFCQKTFSQKINLKTHYKKHESEGLSQLCHSVMDAENVVGNQLNAMTCTVMGEIQNAEDEFSELSRAVLDETTKGNETQFGSLPSTLLVMKASENEFANMSESVLNETEKGKLIQELLSFENIPPENDPLEPFSIDQSEYRRDDSSTLKDTTDANDIYFNASTPTYMVYSNNAVLYDLTDVSECSSLPTFASLSNVP